MDIFLICGYGIPKAIEQDPNYRSYLTIAFNSAYAVAANSEATLICCGGPTSCEAPYTGTEAEAIGAYLQKLIERPETKAACANWQVIAEDRSLSTLENLVFAHDIIRQRALSGSITIFCEATRDKRIKKVAKAVFGKDAKVNVAAIDFDASSNRYLDPKIINKKEKAETKSSLWVLAQPERLAQHHALFERKLAFLRDEQNKGLSHTEAVAQWFKIAPKWMKELMPDAPKSANIKAS